MHLEAKSVRRSKSQEWKMRIKSRLGARINAKRHVSGAVIRRNGKQWNWKIALHAGCLTIYKAVSLVCVEPRREDWLHPKSIHGTHIYKENDP